MYLIKPVGNNCNLACDYCFVRERKENASLNEKNLRLMYGSIVEFTRHTTSSEEIDILLTWHGGEPLLKSAGFYKYAFELQEKLSKKDPKVIFSNQIQTNGYSISSKHIDVFKKYDVGVSVSFDGYPEVHDQHRKTVDGKPTSDRVLNNINSLKNENIKLGLLLVITNDSLGRENDIYNFISSIGIKNFSLNSAVDIDNKSSLVDVLRYGDFLKNLFRIWVNNNNRKVRIKFFEYIIRALAGQSSKLCKFNSKICGNIHSILSNGEVYYCDDYGNKSLEYSLGNILEGDNLLERKIIIKNDIDEKRSHCKKCKWYSICGAGCPRSWNQYRKDVYCVAYKAIFEEINSWMIALGKNTIICN